MFALVLQHPVILWQNLLLRLLSVFGQTVFISLLIPELSKKFGLGHFELGVLYSGATFLSSFLILSAGPLLDRHPFPRICSTAVGCIALSLLMLGEARHPIMVFCGFLGLRFAAQGLLVQLSTVCLSIHFQASRGKALAFSTLGHPLGEAAFPALILTSLEIWGWPATLGAISMVLLLIILPLNLWLIRFHSESEPPLKTDEALRPSLSRWEVLRQKRFLKLLPGMLVPAVVLTGVFFHSAELILQFELPKTTLALGFACLSACRVLCSLSIGPLIDHFGARSLMPWYLGPIALGFFLATIWPGQFGYLGFMTLSGATIGVSSTLITTFLAHAYGTDHLGALRSMTTSMAILGTSISPTLFGYLLEHSIPFTWILGGGMLYSLFGIGLNFIALKYYPH